MNVNNPMHQQFEAKIKSADKSERTITCVIVSNQTNRGRRKVDVKGCSYDDYMKSPVVLAFHDDERVIAKCLWLKFTDEGIIAKFEFRESELAGDIYELYKGGFLTSWSIGFLPVSWNYEEEEGIEIIHITKWVLLEVSAVSIPMDSNAVTLAIDQGLIHDERLIQSVRKSIENSSVSKLIESTTDTLNAIDMLRHDVKEAMDKHFDSIYDINTQITGFMTKLNAVESMMHAIGEKVNSSNAVNIIDFSDFSDEINHQMKTHINRIKGRVS